MALVFRDLGGALAGALSSLVPTQPPSRPGQRAPAGCTPCQARAMAEENVRRAQQAFRNPGAPVFAPRRGR